MSKTKTVNIEEITSVYYFKTLLNNVEKTKETLIIVGKKSIFRQFMKSDVKLRKTAIELTSGGFVKLNLH
ncbi:hypothetical protein HAX40_16405 [Enterococcus casseliflavus]|nr:hypothetical protein [Enterococcus casseliflavus]